MKEGYIRPKEDNRRFYEKLVPVVSATTKVEINGYITRTRQPLEINGKWAMWHSVKGGINEDKKDKKASYEILYNPDGPDKIGEWLKMVPFGARNAEGLENRLRDAAVVGREVLEKSGLTYHAVKLQECMIKTKEGATTYGFTTPHIGPTEEHILKEMHTYEPDESRIAQEFVERMHATSFKLAAWLYLKHGLWVGDSNPGNIIACFNGHKVISSFIDFASRPNKAYNGNVLIKTLDETDVILEKNLSVLYKGFKVQADIHKIPFSRGTKEVEEAFTLLLPERKKELRKSKY